MTTWTREQIIDKLWTDKYWVERGIVALFKQQTADEQEAENTKYHNGRGFNSWAAGPGTYYAKWVLSGRHLSGQYVEKARKICLKHIGQLVKIANGELTEAA